MNFLAKKRSYLLPLITVFIFIAILILGCQKNEQMTDDMNVDLIMSKAKTKVFPYSKDVHVKDTDEQIFTTIKVMSDDVGLLDAINAQTLKLKLFYNEMSDKKESFSSENTNKTITFNEPNLRFYIDASTFPKDMNRLEFEIDEDVEKNYTVYALTTVRVSDGVQAIDVINSQTASSSIVAKGYVFNCDNTDDQIFDVQLSPGSHHLYFHDSPLDHIEVDVYHSSLNSNWSVSTNPDVSCGCGCGCAVMPLMGTETTGNISSFLSSELKYTGKDIMDIYIKHKGEIGLILNSIDSEYVSVNDAMDSFWATTRPLIYNSFGQNNPSVVQSKHIEAANNFLVELAEASKSKELTHTIKVIQSNLHILENRELKDAIKELDNLRLELDK